MNPRRVVINSFAVLVLFLTGLASGTTAFSSPKEWTPKPFRLSEGLIAFYDRPLMTDRFVENVRQIDQETRIGFKDASGKVVIPPIFFVWVNRDLGLGIGAGRYTFFDGVAVVLTGSGYGLVGKDGKFIGRSDYRHIGRDGPGKWSYIDSEPVLFDLGRRVTYGSRKAPSWAPVAHSTKYYFENPALQWSSDMYVDSKGFVGSLHKAYSKESETNKLIFWAVFAGFLFLLSLLVYGAYFWCRSRGMSRFKAAICTVPLLLFVIAFAGTVVFVFSVVVFLLGLAFAMAGGSGRRR